MKRFISLIIALCLACTLLTSAFAVDYYPRYSGDSESIVDALECVGATDTSFSYRERIASMNGISNYSGTATENQYLLHLLKNGELIRNYDTGEDSHPVATPLSAENGSTYFNTYSGNSESISDALKSLGEDGSYSYRELIAEANGISDYIGSAAQNNLLLEKLKEGNLIRPTSSFSSSQSQDLSCSSYAECNSGGTCYEVIVDNCSVHSKPYQKSSIVAYLTLGKPIRVVKMVKNMYGNKWARLDYTDESGNTNSAYIYSKNVMEHKFHTFIPILTTDTGSVEVCLVCGYAEAKYYSDNLSASCDLACVADQAVRGDYSEQTTFWGLVARIAVGEVPFAGTAADIRDLVYDSTHDPKAVVIGADLLAFVPLIGAAHYLSKADDISLVGKGIKYADSAETSLHKIPWGRWSDYEKVAMNGKEYAKIGDFLYTEHAVNEFIPSYIQKATYRFSGHTGDVARGISPSYIQYALTDGVVNGTTIRVASGDTRYASLIKDGIVRDSSYTVFATGSVDIIVDESNNTIVTVITTNRSASEFSELIKVAQ